MIRLENVSKTFTDSNKEVHAVNNVSLTINDGDIFGIIGFSGAGKSTLVRCINLLEKPTDGKVFVDDAETTGLSGKELRKARKKIEHDSPAFQSDAIPDDLWECCLSLARQRAFQRRDQGKGTSPA